MMQAIEMTGTIDEHRHLQLDGNLPFDGPRRVKVIVLYDANDEVEAGEWLEAVASNPAFDFLNEPQEDIYTLEDGRPFRDTK